MNRFRLFLISVLIVSLSITSAAQSKKRASASSHKPSKVGVKGDTRFAAIDDLINKAIADRQIPGAVLLIGHNGKVAYRKAYGHRSLEPRLEPMTLDTIFDIASLTKMVATNTCVMRMFEL